MYLNKYEYISRMVSKSNTELFFFFLKSEIVTRIFFQLIIIIKKEINAKVYTHCHE